VNETIFNTYAVVWFGLVILMAAKAMLDQYQFFKMYRQEINPPFAIVPGERPDKDDPLGIKTSARWIHMIFYKDTRHSRLTAQAKKARLEMIAAIVIAVAGFLLFIPLLVLLGTKS
jgi:hypothetical protein